MQKQQGQALFTPNNKLETWLAQHTADMVDVTNNLKKLQLQVGEQAARKMQLDERPLATKTSAPTWKAFQAATAFAGARRRRAEAAEDVEMAMMEEDHMKDRTIAKATAGETRAQTPPRKQPRVQAESTSTQTSKGAGTGRGGTKRSQLDTGVKKKNAYEEVAAQTLEEDPLVRHDAWMEFRKVQQSNHNDLGKTMRHAMASAVSGSSSDPPPIRAPSRQGRRQEPRGERESIRTRRGAEGGRQTQR